MNNEQVAQQVIEWLGNSIGFIEIQAPLLADDIIRYIVVTRSLALGGFLVGFVACIIATVRLGRTAAKLANDSSYGDELIPGLSSIAAGICAIFFAFFGAIVLSELLKALIAPRMLIIDVLTNRLW